VGTWSVSAHKQVVLFRTGRRVSLSKEMIVDALDTFVSGRTCISGYMSDPRIGDGVVAHSTTFMVALVIIPG
jgi:hypothetical protein